MPCLVPAPAARILWPMRLPLAMVVRGLVEHHRRRMHHRGHHYRHSHHRHSAAGDMLTHAGLEALLASVPTVIMLSVREALTDGVRRTLHGAIAKGEHAAGEAVSQAAGKLSVSAPIVVAAVVIGAAVLHGAWRGKRHYEARSFAEAEEERRAQGEAPAFARA